MSPNLFLIILFLASALLSACAAPPTPVAWTAYHAASDTLVNPQFPAYSFEYPTIWQIEEGVNHLAFVSEAALLQDLPESLQPGQILVGLSVNLRMSPEEMVESYSSSLGSMIEFGEIVSITLNGRPAAYQQGAGKETGDALFVLAVDMGHGTQLRGLLTARTAKGELVKWKDVLFKMAGSLRVDE